MSLWQTSRDLWPLSHNRLRLGVRSGPPAPKMSWALRRKRGDADVRGRPPCWTGWGTSSEPLLRRQTQWWGGDSAAVRVHEWRRGRSLRPGRRPRPRWALQTNTMSVRLDVSESELTAGLGGSRTLKWSASVPRVSERRLSSGAEHGHLQQRLAAQWLRTHQHQHTHTRHWCSHSRLCVCRRFSPKDAEVPLVSAGRRIRVVSSSAWEWTWTDTASAALSRYHQHHDSTPSRLLS